MALKIAKPVWFVTLVTKERTIRYRQLLDAPGSMIQIAAPKKSLNLWVELADGDLSRSPPPQTVLHRFHRWGHDDMGFVVYVEEGASFSLDDLPPRH